MEAAGTYPIDHLNEHYGNNNLNNTKNRNLKTYFRNPDHQKTIFLEIMISKKNVNALSP